MENEQSARAIQATASSEPKCYWHDFDNCWTVDEEISASRLFRTARKGTAHMSFHAAKNPNLKPRHRRAIIKALQNPGRPSHLFPGGTGVIKNPELTDEELHQLAKYNSSDVLAALPSHMHRLNLDAQLSVVSSSYVPIHAEVAQIEGLAPEVYGQSYHIAQYHENILQMLAENPSVPGNLLYRIIRLNRFEDVTFAALKNKSLPIGFLFKRDDWERNPEAYDRAVYARREESEEWLAAKGFELNVPVEWLRELI